MKLKWSLYDWVKIKPSKGERDVSVATNRRPETTHRHGAYNDHVTTTTTYRPPSNLSRGGQAAFHTHHHVYVGASDFSGSCGYAGSYASDAPVRLRPPSMIVRYALSLTRGTQGPGHAGMTGTSKRARTHRRDGVPHAAAVRPVSKRIAGAAGSTEARPPGVGCGRRARRAGSSNGRGLLP